MMYESERQTRKKRIDPLIQKAGWKIVPYNSSDSLAKYNKCAIEEYPTDAGPADYALCLDGQILGVVEAKKVSLGPQNVLTQAERYSKGLTNNPVNYHGYHVPFLYSTNGEIIWYDDVRYPQHRSRKIAAFHTPEALNEQLSYDFDSTCSNLLETPNAHPRLRPYQIEANNAVEQAISERKHQMLVAMATGTGKTFTMVNQVYRLMKSGVAKRILFLVDRRALAAQAVRAFASFEPEHNKKFNQIYEVYSQRFYREDFEEDFKYDPLILPNSYLTNPKPGDAFVYVSTIQRMTINLFGRNIIPSLGDEQVEEDADILDIPIHAFDLIIADECHRGYTSSESAIWLKTLQYFDAIKIGLTATPAAHTTAFFNNIVYKYDYERAVKEGFLVDYDLVTVKSNVRMNGVFLNEGEEVGVIDPETGQEKMDQLEDERQFDTTEIEEKVTAPDSNRKILEELKTYAIDHQEKYGRFPKTLIFAVNDLHHTSHADQLVDSARDIFGQGDSFVQKITGRVDRPLQRIREFRNRPLPGIVVTVDMLSTGVDIPDLEYIVFLRPVKSRILFEQMMGRGTRRGEHFPEKSHFTVFDCFDGTLMEYFKHTTAITTEPPQKESRSILDIIDDIWENRDREYNTRCLVKRLQRIDKEMSSEARSAFSTYLPDGDVARYSRGLPELLRHDFTTTMSLLRNPDFQDLLIHYKRKPRSFLVAYDTEDTVSSELRIRDGRGHEYKPEDYLIAFSTFVKEHADEIESIQILLDRPKDWGTDVLNELRTKLAAAPQHFTVQNLQKVHAIRYDKALADIISMVKHAAREQEPLYTAEERVNLAFRKVTYGKTFTSEQQQWLDRIKNHLIENLSIDRTDFDSMPVFNRAGGWTRADTVFNKQLEELLENFNEAIAV
ncbi:MAG: DEAD/DEAH box helicase family protein [Dehalococcoidales bacterium]|nr:DEAD/DEAH box helicase family protein [Dehalococcoidales bacterium]